MPTTPSTSSLVFFAIIPAVIIFVFIYLKDKVEKEPLGLLTGLFFLGVLSTLAAGYSEVGLLKVLSRGLSESTVLYRFIEYFFIVALSEEGVKFIILRLLTWKNKNFNYTFDAVVYAVVISLGFATLENILYVTENGTLEIAFWRGILSVPGHAIDAVFMGLYFGRAKYCQCSGNPGGKSKNMFLAFLVPLCTHGFYDFILSLQPDYGTGVLVVFFAFVITVTIIALVVINRASKTDTPIPGMGVPFWQYPQYPYNYYDQQRQQFGYQYQNAYAQPQYQQPYQPQQQYQQYQPQQQGYYTPNGYTQPNTQYQGYSQNGYAQQGQYQQGGYNNNNNFNNFNGR